MIGEGIGMKLGLPALLLAGSGIVGSIVPTGYEIFETAGVPVLMGIALMIMARVIKHLYQHNQVQQEECHKVHAARLEENTKAMTDSAAACREMTHAAHRLGDAADKVCESAKWCKTLHQGEQEET